MKCTKFKKKNLSLKHSDVQWLERQGESINETRTHGQWAKGESKIYCFGVRWRKCFKKEEAVNCSKCFWWSQTEFWTTMMEFNNAEVADLLDKSYFHQVVVGWWIVSGENWEEQKTLKRRYEFWCQSTYIDEIAATKGNRIKRKNTLLFFLMEKL